MENFMSKPNGFVMPRSGENILMICTNCNWCGSAKIPGMGIDFSTGKRKRFPKPKCPNCGKKSLIKDPAVLY